MNISEKRWRWTAAAGRRTFLITSDNKANRNCPETEISIQFLSAADCLWECFASINVKSSATPQTQSQQKSALLILAPSEEILNNGWVCVAVCEGSAHKRDDALGGVFNAAENPFSRQWGGWFSFCELKQLAVKLPFVCFVWMRCSSLESRLSPSASKLFTDRKKAITALKKWILWRWDEVRDREIKSFWTDWWILAKTRSFPEPNHENRVVTSRHVSWKWKSILISYYQWGLVPALTRIRQNHRHKNLSPWTLQDQQDLQTVTCSILM